MSAASPCPVTVQSPAKINLWLRILGKRPDQYHELESRLVKIDLHDSLTFLPIEGEQSELHCDQPTVPTDGSNLVLKALHLFYETTGLKQAWRIDLQKQIPHGAGLGGGSSNAASALRFLNQHHELPLAEERLLEIAAKLGADVPFFLYEGACDVTGTGAQITPVKDFQWQLPMVLIKPNFGIPTPWAYQRWQSSCELPGVSYSPQLCDWGAMVNHLERPVFEKWIMLPTLKQWFLAQKETRAALMSGSGSTVFAICEDGAQAHQLAEKARQLVGDTAFVTVTQTLP